MDFRAALLLATACLLLLAASDGAGAQTVSRSRNGIRLVGDNGARGRLEISTKDPGFPGCGNNSVAWVPVCDFSCTDLTAETMCKLLGYAYGRKYYSARVNYRSAESGYTAGYFSCFPRSPPPPRSNRRLLEDPGAGSSAATLPDEDDDDGGGGVGGGDGDGVLRREALSLSRYIVNTPAGAPYTCAFYFGNCDPQGPLVGIECSNAPMPPLPPPPRLPRLPPAPPPLPVNYSASIRLVGGAQNKGSVEPNLCSSVSPEFCAKYGRVELQMTVPGGSGYRLWAPLCAPVNTSTSLAAVIAQVACQQEYDWPSLKASPGLHVTEAMPEHPPLYYTLPKGAVTNRGHFNPASVRLWATITSIGSSSNPRTLQDMTIMLSTTPCRNRALFALACNVSGGKS